MPKIVRFYIMHCIIGFAVAAAFTGLILWFNVANLWHLVSTSDIGVMAVVVFWVLNGIVFAGVQNGIAIMMMSENGNEGHGPRGGSAVPVRVAASSPAKGMTRNS